MFQSKIIFSSNQKPFKNIISNNQKQILTPISFIINHVKTTLFHIKLVLTFDIFERKMVIYALILLNFFSQTFKIGFLYPSFQKPFSIDMKQSNYIPSIYRILIFSLSSRRKFRNNDSFRNGFYL